MPPDFSAVIENQKLEQTLARLAQEAGDEKWVLALDSSPKDKSPHGSTFQINRVGYDVIDLQESVDESIDDPQVDLPPHGLQPFGRKSYGRFNKKIEVSHPGTTGRAICKRSPRACLPSRPQNG